MDTIRSIINGDKKAFKKVYDSWYQRLFSFALKSTRNANDAEDLTQEIFIRIWENRNRFVEEISIESQFFTIARNITIDYYRKKVAQSNLLLKLENEIRYYNESNESESPLNSQHIIRLKKAIENLPQKRREIFKLNKYFGLTYEEIANEMGISKNTVHSQISKALSTIRSKLVSFL